MLNSSELNNSIRIKVKNELTNSIYPNLLITIPTLAFVASILFFKLRTHLGESHMLAWLGIFIALTACQAALAIWFNHTKNQLKWENLYFKLLIADVALIGTLWGVTSVLFMPPDTIGQSYLIVILAFVAAGGPLYLAGSYLAGAVYTTCTLAPLIGSLVFISMSQTHHEVYFNLTVALACYWFFLVMASYHSSKLLSENFTLRLENTALSEDLSQTSEELEKINTISCTEKEKLFLSTNHNTNMPQVALSDLEYTDALTGLDTQKIMKIKYIQSRAYARRHHQNFAVFRININNNNEVKTTLGKEVSDLLLKTVAVRLQYCKRETDILSRLDENKFALIVSEVLFGNEVMTVVNRIFKIFAEKTIINDNKVQINASIGISMYPKDGNDLSELISNSDRALAYLYSEDKPDQRNFQVYDPDIMGIELNNKSEKKHSSLP
jgi:diguanylate cyclase (GGDEF)-like protein